MRKLAFWLSLVMLFTIPWENIVLFPGVGTASRFVGLGVGVFWLATIVVTGRFRKPQPFHVAIYAFLLWNAVSAFWTLDFEATLRSIKTYFQLAILVLILWDLYTTPAALKAGLQAYVLGAYVSIGSTVANSIHGSAAAIDRTYQRVAATGFNKNDLGLILAFGIPVAWYLATSRSNGKMSSVLRWLNYAYIPAALLGIMLTASRGSLVAALPGLLYVVASLTRFNLFRRVVILAALVAALFALQPLVPQSSLARLATTGTSIATGDLGGRLDIWRTMGAVAAEHPLLGVGSDAFRDIMPGGSHNSFISIMVGLGVIGFGLFATILATAVYQAVHLPKRDAYFWLTVLLVWATGNSVHNWELEKPTWLFLGLVIVSAGLTTQRHKVISRAKVHAQSRGFPKGGRDATEAAASSAYRARLGDIDRGDRLPFPHGEEHRGQWLADR